MVGILILSIIVRPHGLGGNAWQRHTHLEGDEVWIDFDTHTDSVSDVNFKGLVMHIEATVESDIRAIVTIQVD